LPVHILSSPEPHVFPLDDQRWAQRFRLIAQPSILVQFPLEACKEPPLSVAAGFLRGLEEAKNLLAECFRFVKRSLQAFACPSHRLVFLFADF
jgi:hypothetical protein